MRIAIVSTMLPPEGTGGAEAYAALLAQTLVREHERRPRVRSVGEATPPHAPRLQDVGELLVEERRDPGRGPEHGEGDVAREEVVGMRCGPLRRKDARERPTWNRPRAPATPERQD